MSADVAKIPQPAKPSVPFSKWLPVVLIAWAIPGGGHIYLKQTQRGANKRTAMAEGRSHLMKTSGELDIFGTGH